MEATVEAIDARTKQLSEEVVQLRDQMRGLHSLLRELVMSTRRMREVHAWQLERAKVRGRQNKCRKLKAIKLEASRDERRASRTKNAPKHSIMNSLSTIILSKPDMVSIMRAFLTTRNVKDPAQWLMWEASLCPRRAMTLLFSLYNSACWEPWLKLGGNTTRIFRSWDGDKAKWSRGIPNGQILPKIVPPKTWTDSAVQSFCECWCWKIMTIIYRFVDDLDLEASEDLEGFFSHVQLFSQFSLYEVLPEREWAPEDMYTWERHLALRAYRKVAPRLKTIRACMEAGLSHDFVEMTTTTSTDSES